MKGASKVKVCVRSIGDDEEGGARVDNGTRVTVVDRLRDAERVTVHLEVVELHYKRARSISRRS